MLGASRRRRRRPASGPTCRRRPPRCRIRPPISAVRSSPDLGAASRESLPQHAAIDAVRSSRRVEPMIRRIALVPDVLRAMLVPGPYRGRVPRADRNERVQLVEPPAGGDGVRAVDRERTQRASQLAEDRRYALDARRALLGGRVLAGDLLLA